MSGRALRVVEGERTEKLRRVELTMENVKLHYFLWFLLPRK